MDYKLLYIAKIKKVMTMFIVMTFFTLLGLKVQAEPFDSSLPKQTPTDAEGLTVSLITCYPGPEVYELCGHEAIRIRGEGMDSVWNYGLFSFSEPNFVYRFVKGETDYMVGGYPFAWFMPEYIRRGSKVVEQDLNLTPDEARNVLHLLRENSLVQNRTYRYNYVRDNCATRIVDILERATNERFLIRDSVKYGTWREEMRHYHRNYPWYQFGIDLALGSGMDVPQNRRGEMFVPVEMMESMQTSERINGQKIVSTSRVLYEGCDGAVAPPTPLYLTPLFWSIAVVVFSIVIALCDIYNGRITKLWFSIFFVVLGMAGVVITFLVLCSQHEATSPNILIYWLNPMQLIVGVLVWFSRASRVENILVWIDTIIMTALLLVWPMQLQSANVAFFPLMGATLALCLSYLIVKHKQSTLKTGGYKQRSVNRKKNRKTTVKKKRK